MILQLILNFSLSLANGALMGRDSMMARPYCFLESPARTLCGQSSLFIKLSIQRLFLINVPCTQLKCLSEQLLVWVHCTP